METNTTLTTKQIEDVLNRMETNLKNADIALQLVRHDMSEIEKDRRQGSDMKAARLKKLEPKLVNAEQEAIDAADVARRYLDEVLTLTGGNEPALTDAEMSAARAQRDFVIEDVEERSIDELIQTARHALVTEDRPLIFNLVRYAPRRLSNVTWADTASKNAGETLQKLIREGQAFLRDSRLDAHQKRAKDMLSTASNLDWEGRKRERANVKHGFQSEKEVSW